MFRNILFSKYILIFSFLQVVFADNVHFGHISQKLSSVAHKGQRTGGGDSHVLNEANFGGAYLLDTNLFYGPACVLCVTLLSSFPKAKLLKSSHFRWWAFCQSATWVSITVITAASPPLHAHRWLYGLCMKSPSTSHGPKCVSRAVFLKTNHFVSMRSVIKQDFDTMLLLSWLSLPHRSSPQRRMQSRWHRCRTTSDTSIPPSAALSPCPKMPNCSRGRPVVPSGQLCRCSCFTSFCWEFSFLHFSQKSRKDNDVEQGWMHVF